MIGTGGISREATKARSYQCFLRVFVSSWRPAAVLIQRGWSTRKLAPSAEFTAECGSGSHGAIVKKQISSKGWAFARRAHDWSGEERM